MTELTIEEQVEYLQAQLQAEHNTRLGVEQYAAAWKDECLAAKAELVKLSSDDHFTLNKWVFIAIVIFEFLLGLIFGGIVY